MRPNYSRCKVEIILLCCLETDGFICQAALSAPVYTWRDNPSRGSQICQRLNHLGCNAPRTPVILIYTVLPLHHSSLTEVSDRLWLRYMVHVIINTNKTSMTSQTLLEILLPIVKV